MATVASQTLPFDGTALTYSAASGGGDRFTPGSRSLMHIINGSGSSITATIVTPGTFNGLAIADRTVVVPAGTSRVIALPAPDYTAADGLADITWSATTTVTFAVAYIA